MLRGIISGLLESLYPRVCLACNTKLGKSRPSVDNLVCLDCWTKIRKNQPPFCRRCGRHLERASLNRHICPSCIRRSLHFDRAYSPARYEGIIKELIHKFKYESKDYLGQSLSRLMIEFIREYSLPMDFIDVIVPVPLHTSRLREREFNQAEVLGNHIASEFSKTMLNRCLLRHRYTKTQTELEEGLRLSNVKDSFQVASRADVKGKNVLLVDDVLTSGATSSEAAFTLKDAGANIVFVLTLAN